MHKNASTCVKRVCLYPTFMSLADLLILTRERTFGPYNAHLKGQHQLPEIITQIKRSHCNLHS